MALQVVTKKRFVNSLEKTIQYLKENWSKKVAEDFYIQVIKKIDLLVAYPIQVNPQQLKIQKAFWWVKKIKIEFSTVLKRIN